MSTFLLISIIILHVYELLTSRALFYYSVKTKLVILHS